MLTGRLEEMQDNELLTRFQEGDAEAFRVLLVRYRRPVYNFVLRTVREPETAEDLTQDVFIRVIRRGSDFQQQSKFSTWMYTIARNLCIDHLRKMRHRRHASLDAPVSGDDGAAPLNERIALHDPSVDRKAAGNDMRERIAAAVEGLPEEQREVFLLRQVQGMPFGEIARVTGTPENTVKSRMRYALERLQEALADFRDDREALGGAI